ncbi:MAG: NAD(P)/FAD-dependent oxidoreductase, partial [Betaproteobacteria bacterium]
IHVNHLPYLPFPPTWPNYLPKDMVADWFETYCWAMEINFWTNTELIKASYDESNGLWTAIIRQANGVERTLYPRHLIFANGIVGSPRIPSLPGLDNFKGEVIHSSQFTSGGSWRGKNALVLGAGNSGHDVAQDLYSNGVNTTLIQRGPTTVISIEPSAKLVYWIYEGIPLDDGDLLTITNTLPIVISNLKRLAARMVENDKELISGLKSRGFKFDIGEDGTGHQMKLRKRYGGYYLNAGCSDLIVSGDIGLLQYEKIERFISTGVMLDDSSVKPADLLVLATGYEPQSVLVSKLLGDEIANKVGEIWGIAPNGEMNNMWIQTAQRGLWFVGGGFPNCRIYSKYVALQIKAIEEGLLTWAN